MWINGVIGSFYFEAKVFDEPSRFGISNGRISKLVIRDENRKICCQYDRGWVEKPSDDAVKEAVLKVLDIYK